MVAELHEFLKDPLRREILLKLGRHDGISLDELLKELKTSDPQEVLRQLKLLGDLVTKTEDDQYSLTEQGVSRKAGGQYKLNEKGFDAVNEMIAFPEIESANYKEKVDEKFHSKRSLQRFKLINIIAGLFSGFFVCFFASLFLSIFSRELFPGTNFFWGFTWPYIVAQFIIAPLVGMPIGYWLGKRRHFKRPEPEWNN